MEGAIEESLMDTWRRIDFLSFRYPPCLYKNGDSYLQYASQLYADPTANYPREVERHLFFEFHCSDSRKNGVVRGEPISGSFNWPLYRDKTTLMYKFVPLQPLMEHLTNNFGPNCDYGGASNENNIYPQQVTFNDSSTGNTVTVDRSEFVGCNGYPLIWFADEFRKNPTEMASIGVTDLIRDAHVACFSSLLAGWCEAILEPLIFMRDDFEVTCDGSNGSIPVTCPHDCRAMQGQWANHPLQKEIEEVPGYYPFVKSKKRYILGRKKDGISSASSNRTDLPYRRMLLHEFIAATEDWELYKNPKTQTRWLSEVEENKLAVGNTCFQGSLAAQKAKCTWPM